MQGKIPSYWPQIQAVPLTWLSLGFLAGIALAAALGWPPAAGLAGLAAVLLWGFASGRQRPQNGNWKLLLAVLSVFLLGVLRYQSTQTQPTPVDLAYHVGEDVRLVGKVLRPLVTRDAYTEAYAQAEYLLSPAGERVEINGQVQLRLPLDASWDYGDRLRLEGRLEIPGVAGGPSYAGYLARFGVDAVMAFPQVRYVGTGEINPLLTVLYAFRAHGLDTLHRLYANPEAALLAGILLGDESGLSADRKVAYNDSGLRHIIAISGFNITIIAALLLAVFGRWFGARRGAWLAVVGIALYTILVGADAAVLRAAVMGGLAVLARQVGRRQFALNTLAFTAAIMALFNPLLLWDVGFQLSFAATLGILLYADRMSARAHAWLQARVDPEWLARLSPILTELVIITLAAQITTLPLLLYHFQRLSLVSLPANLLVLPAQPALMVLAGSSVLIGMLLLPAGQVLAWVAWPLAAYSNRMAEVFASLPGAAYPIAPFDLIWLVLLYLVLFAFTLGWEWLRSRLPRPQPALLGAVLAALSISLWSVALNAPDGRLQLTLLDVGTGEALLLRTPEGRNLLINGGPSALDLADELGRSQPPFQRQLDWLVVAGVRQEQLAGLINSLERLAPANVAWAGEVQASYAAEQLHGRLNDLDFEVQVLQTGQRFDLGSGAYLEVLGSGSRGAVLLLAWDDFRALLPLGLDFDLLDEMDQGWPLGPIDLLLLADNGYLPLNPGEWLENLNPALIWFAVGEEQPAPEFLDQLEGRSVLRSDVHGWLRITTDGRQMWLEHAE